MYPTRGLQSPLDEGTAVLIEPDLISKKSVLKPGDQGSRDRELVAEALTRPWAVGPANYLLYIDVIVQSNFRLASVARFQNVFGLVYMTRTRMTTNVCSLAELVH